LQQGHAHGSANPHYWLDPANGEIMSAVVAEAMTRIFPEKREIIAAAQARFAGELQKRLEKWSAALSPFRGVAVVTYHNSWPYFARRFRLNIADVVEPKESVTPSPTRLVTLASKMREAKVRVLIQEPFAPADASHYLASRSGASILTLAPSVGALEGTGDYLSLFDRNVGLLVETLSKPR
jgi:ABC-type Zn uptake system ZnuABC Zn-binding protein ZnuA